MRAPVSVVIPTLDAAPVLPACLLSLIEGLDTGLLRELIVSDGGSCDATIALAKEAGAWVLSGRTGRGGQLKRGGEAAQGDWLLFLHADTILAPGWSKTVADHIGSSDKAAYFQLRFRAAGSAPRLVARWANFRSRLFGLPYGDQGLLISRALYDQVGGFADQPLMEDVAMARSLRGRLIGLKSFAETGAEKYARAGWLRRGGRNLWTLARYLTGSSPDKLAEFYHRP